MINELIEHMKEGNVTGVENGLIIAFENYAEEKIKEKTKELEDRTKELENSYKENLRKVARGLLNKGLNINEIANLTGLSIDEINML